MYLDILNDDMEGFANIMAKEMLEHLFITYGSITAVDLEHNFEQMRKAWDPQQPVVPCSSRFKIVLIFLRQEAWKLAILSRSTWDTTRSLPHATS
jgi:hypothetical protein